MSPAPTEPFDRRAIEAALRALGDRLAARGLQGELFVVGGAAIALAYDARRATKDVDGVFEPKAVIYEIAGEIADELGYPPGWLNDAVKGYIPQGALGDRGHVYAFEGLTVRVAAAETLLAMKVAAARVGEDETDVALLAGMLDLRTADEVLAVAVDVLGDAATRLTPRSQLLVEAVFDEDAER